MLSDKRRLLRDEEAKFHEIERKIRDKHLNERTLAGRLKHEYEDLRGRFEQMAFELRFSIEDELRIYARLLDELMKKSSIATTQATENLTTIRSAGIDDLQTSSLFQPTRSGSSGIFDLASSHSGWQQTRNLSDSTENLCKSNEHEIQETYDGDSIIRSSSFPTSN
jgi:hypothetical protein